MEKKYFKAGLWVLLVVAALWAFFPTLEPLIAPQINYSQLVGVSKIDSFIAKAVGSIRTTSLYGEGLVGLGALFVVVLFYGGKVVKCFKKLASAIKGEWGEDTLVEVLSALIPLILAFGPILKLGLWNIVSFVWRYLNNPQVQAQVDAEGFSLRSLGFRPSSGFHWWFLAIIIAIIMLAWMVGDGKEEEEEEKEEDEDEEEDNKKKKKGFTIHIGG